MSESYLKSTFRWLAECGVIWTVTLAVLLAGPSGCGFLDNNGNNNSGSGGTQTSFATTVVIGDSLSAGFQNGSLLDSQQPNGWASLVVKQANGPLVLPLIAPPGAPAVLQLTSVGPPPVIQQDSGVTTGRDNLSNQPYDLAVPGHKLNDLINAAPTLVPTTDEDIITNLVLGFPVGDDRSQMNEAIALKPTAVFLWIGNDDALVADTSGSPVSMTDVATFTQDFQQLMTALHTQTKATLIVANIPDVTLVPYLTPAAIVIAQAAAETGQSQTQITAELGIQAGDLVNATGLSQAQSAVSAIQKGNTPMPLTDSGFLSAAEITQVQTTVDQYNMAIAQEVTAAGGVLVDINTYIKTLAQNGVMINNYNATTGFLGGLFSLDGLHPTNTGYALIANQFITAINTNMKTNLAQVNVSTVAAADPLFGPNIKATGSTAMIPLSAAHTTDAIVNGCRGGCPGLVQR
jgi:lysophospholipase L1-like esterase